MSHSPTLHMMCGKIAAGKSTLSAELAQRPGTVVLSEDDLLHGLYADQIATLRDFVRCTNRIRAVLTPHIVALLRSGLSVVLDFQANTVESRVWMRDLIDKAGVAHVLHVLDVPDEVCLARLSVRNAAGTHAYAATEAQFHEVSKHFVPPTVEEGYEIRVHRPE